MWGGAHIVYQIQLCNCVMVAEDRGTEEGGREKKKKLLTNYRGVCAWIVQYGFHICSNGAQGNGNDIWKEGAADKRQTIIFPVPFLVFCVG